MMKSTKVTRAELRQRLARSVMAGAVFGFFVVGTFLSIRFGPKQQGLPSVFRATQSFNEQVIGTSGRGAPCKPPPPKGTEPRVNGTIGLDDEVDDETYRVIVDSGSKHLELRVADIRAMPRIEAVTDFKCVEGWTEVLQYAGVRFSDFMKIEGIGLRADGTPYPYVGMETPDKKYYVSVDTKSIMAPDAVLAWEENGAELSVDNGYPLRLVIPSKYGIKNLKRIGRIFFSDERPPDYWHRRGYDWFSGL